MVQEGLKRVAKGRGLTVPPVRWRRGGRSYLHGLKKQCRKADQHVQSSARVPVLKELEWLSGEQKGSTKPAWSGQALEAKKGPKHSPECASDPALQLEQKLL